MSGFFEFCFLERNVVLCLWLFWVWLLDRNIFGFWKFLVRFWYYSGGRFYRWKKKKVLPMQSQLASTWQFESRFVLYSRKKGKRKRRGHNKKTDTADFPSTFWFIGSTQPLLSCDLNFTICTLLIYFFSAKRPPARADAPSSIANFFSWRRRLNITLKSHKRPRFYRSILPTYRNSKRE